MILEEVKRGVADVANIKIVESNEKYYILVEWSREAVESFKEYEEAQDFAFGYLGIEGLDSIAYRNGQMLRSFVEIDLEDGAAYFKVSDLERYS